MVKKIKIKKLPEEIKEAIQISELKYRRLFETAQDGVLLLDAQTGQINDVNPFLMRLLGYSKKEFLNKKLWDIGAFVDIQAAKKAFRILKKKRYVRYKNLPLQTKQGKLINVEFVSNVYGLDHEKVIQCNIRDITERRKTEIIIKENEEKFRHIYENNRDGVMVVDIKSRKFIIGNNAFCKMIGYSAKELIKIGVDDIHPKKDLPFVLKKFSQMVQGITKTADNLPVKRKDGSIFYVDVVASPVNLYGKKYIMGSFRDITERKKVEEVIRESEKKFRTIFDNSRDGIILADAKSRNFLMANNSVCRMLKYSKKEILKIGVENIHPQNKLNYVIKQFNRQLRGEIKLASQLPVKKKNGEIFYADVIATPLELSGKKCILGSFRDVTKSKKAEEIIKENEEKYRTIFNASPDLIVIIDKKGNILDANNLVDSWMKYKRKDIIGKKVLNLDFFTPESKKMVGKKIKERFTNKKMGVYELNFINKKEK